MSGVERRTTIKAAAVGAAALPLLAACGKEDAESSAGQDPTKGAGSGGAGGDALVVPKSDVPVGSGVILGSAGFVVTQPTEGDFKAFKAICTHQGCLVAEIGADILCTCHASRFALVDGAPISGPAQSPLVPATVTESGEDLLIS